MWQPGSEGRSWENGYIYSMAESLHCSPETITTLLNGYIPIQNKKFKKDEYIIKKLWSVMALLWPWSQKDLSFISSTSTYSLHGHGLEITSLSRAVSPSSNCSSKLILEGLLGDWMGKRRYWGWRKAWHTLLMLGFTNSNYSSHPRSGHVILNTTLNCWFHILWGIGKIYNMSGKGYLETRFEKAVVLWVWTPKVWVLPVLPLPSSVILGKAQLTCGLDPTCKVMEG